MWMENLAIKELNLLSPLAVLIFPMVLSMMRLTKKPSAGWAIGKTNFFLIC